MLPTCSAVTTAETGMESEDEHDQDDFAGIFGPTSSSSQVEQTIAVMEATQLVVHPAHCHSFQQVNFMFGIRSCAGCHQRLQTVVFGAGDDAAKQIVRCVACGVYAHRTCALGQEQAWKQVCAVNAAQLSQSNDEDENDIGELVEHSASHEEDPPPKTSVPPTEAFDQPAPWTSVPWMPATLRFEQLPDESWSNVASVKNRIPSIALPRTSSNDLDDSADIEGEQVHVSPLHYANHPFASVSRALQENIAAHFRRLGEEVTGKAPQTHEPSTTQDGEREQHPLVRFASGTIESVKSAVRNHPDKVGAAAVAGGIAGGVAGLALAGPVGAYAGLQAGTAGALGVILEGSVSIGVFVASVATGASTAQQIKEQMDQRRVLTMGEHGTSRKVILVRPSICINSIWDQIYAEARRSAPNNPLAGFTFLPKLDPASHERYGRDSDIVRTDEEEIPTTDKVILLVSRLLSDKSSLPGYVYRYLIDAFHDRCAERQLESGDEEVEGSPRIRRDDAHAVIKYVTVALLEVKPGLSSTAALTELTATAVEGLVFGKVYDTVFEEIVAETAEHDKALVDKISRFQSHSLPQDLVSADGLKALRLLPESHSAVDKLYHCVRFLEHISDHFTNKGGGGLCADSLLKMVCQHIIAAKVTGMNAEVAFLEEFARDEQLLRGREGYSLVTLQASLHFLNMSEDLERDIFGQDDNEENVPVAASDLSDELLLDDEND